MNDVNIYRTFIKTLTSIMARNLEDPVHEERNKVHPIKSSGISLDEIDIEKVIAHSLSPAGSLRRFAWPGLRLPGRVLVRRKTRVEADRPAHLSQPAKRLCVPQNRGKATRGAQGGVATPHHAHLQKILAHT